MTEVVVGAPASALRPWVDRYLGYRDPVATPLVRREVAGAFVVLILGWGDPLDVIEPRSAERGAYGVDSFVAGPFDSYCLTRTVGTGLGVQVFLTPPAARRILGLPLGELANRAVGVADLPGGWWSRLRLRLAEADDWAHRFAVLDAALTERLGGTAAPDPRLAGAWRRLAGQGGQLGIGRLAEEVGWSRRHLAAVFRREFGLTPKVAARLLRFQRAHSLLPPSPLLPPDPDCGPADLADPRGGLADLDCGPADRYRWAEIAVRCGYFDQAHLIRDFREFAGTTPTVLAGERTPAG
ncbi:helix-turn-helix domain-containing protein [Micromonospora echinofusca]|uniref:Helix-turn-helix domain-containing protein n=1 Tax=Micromonospora echinofusca TaxID=47858 RepID=A0ABS3VY03_MICEH|nr:helix-turn-helix domain-containing protein [Micromonospora echinofusca]MBO4209424.1 helix-turn-helix domain-containing protein [Micromonospora echinofusca]